MFETLINELARQGPIGVILALSLWYNVKLVRRLFNIIENNTKAITEFTLAQKERRKKYNG
jgi:hypothetical protein